MRFFTFLLIFLFQLASLNAFAIEIFGGLGLGAGLMDLELKGASSGRSHFATQTLFGEAGLTFSISGKNSILLSGVLGQSSSKNSNENSNNLEVGVANFKSGRIAAKFDKLVIGIGGQKTDLKIRSITLPGPGFQESQFTGISYEAMAKISFEFEKKYRFDAGAKYLMGDLKSTDSTSTNLLQMTTVDMFLTFFVLVD